MVQITISQLAVIFNLRRSIFYHRLTKPADDELLKDKIKAVMKANPAYGHKRVALELNLNKKRILRVMNEFNLHPQRVRQRLWPDKPKDKAKPTTKYQNLIETVKPIRPNHIWVSDFTYLRFNSGFVYLSTIVDRYTREVVGWNISRYHNQALVIGALTQALKQTGFQLPEYLHSDQGGEYDSQAYTKLAESLGIKISMSRKASPWENPHQESYYSHFKLDLDNPNRFETLGKLIEAVYQTINYYNQRRIQSVLKMPPVKFRQQYYEQLTVKNEC